MYAVDLIDVRWRKTSRSGGGNNGACVEVASAEAKWRKSGRSGSGTGNACVEVAFAGPAVAVRDSKDPGGPVLAFPASSWAAFLARVAGR
ncbi:uncharacterized protein DUF397 [Saccharopolyspora spinosa]|uniref:Uncharacterized protein DUF397 n=2 Tax=Saccharopolyspora spinosa TaxID=60894 RepID=A0A2N3XRM9_SACSN|nr:DUF397 domain-containing protein [Saccharopolyspora spinosa]PKW13291.1 uncharacterized protein DUF397 [Saccharopolyspora spinosa]